MRRVLLAVDGSPASDDAARLLARLPHDEPWQLRILTVIQHPSARGSYASAELLRQEWEQTQQSALATYKTAAAMFDGADVDVERQILEGNIGEQICESAEQWDADLVVLGATGRSQLGRVLLGSVSDHVATHATCSVLVVRGGEDLMRHHPIRIAVAYEANGPSQAALEEISEIPWRTGTQLSLVSIANYSVGAYGETIRDPAAMKQCQQDLEQADECLADSIPNRDLHLIESAHRGEGLVNFAQSNAIDLMVVGETNRRALTRFLLGSTSRYVLRHAPCSVWLSRKSTIVGRLKTAASSDGRGVSTTS